MIVQNDQQIAQSGNIDRFIAKKANMLPNDDILDAKADSIFEASNEMFFPLNPTVNFAVGGVIKEEKSTMINNVVDRLKSFENILNNTLNGPFFLVKKPFYCDFGIYHHLSLLRKLSNNIFEKYLNKSKFMNAMEGIEFN